MPKVLVVDDDPASVNMLARRLEADNYEVISASDGDEALEKVRKEDPDLIVLDIMMPKMDGYTFVRALKKIPKNTPVIVVTGKKHMADIFKIEGVKDYIVKPYEAKELLGKIEAILK